MAAKSMNGIPDPSLRVQKTSVEALSLEGKKVVVVGGTDGLGRAIAPLALARGARVTVAGRTLRDEARPGLTFVRTDLSSMRAARELGETLDADVDVVVLTAGIMAAPQRETTSEGIERDLAISALSRVALLRAYAPRLAQAKRGRPRVFVMGFPGSGELGNPDDLNAERSYDAMAAHYNTVALNEALVLDARERWRELDVFGLNPGGVKTNIRANYLGEGSLKHRLAELLIGILMPSADTYARGIVPLFVAPELEGRSGAMFGKKGTAILPSSGLAGERTARFVAAADALLAQAER
jgi:NAD(P)-dependent dehydrogenase (short-subunit alcohol dehydrogenase family)